MSRIKYVHGNLLDVNQGVIIHGCNSRGVMGGGIALQIKNKYPQTFKSYRQWYEKVTANDKDAALPLGEIQITEPLPGLFIVNAITQDLYGRANTRYVSYDAIEECFHTLSDLVLEADINIIRFPQIGAGLAQGNWKIIESIIENTVDESINLECFLFKP